MRLDRLITIFETLAIVGRPVSAADVQMTIGSPKPTCHQHIQALQKHRPTTSPADDGKFVVGERLIGMVRLGKSDGNIQRATLELQDNVMQGVLKCLTLLSQTTEPELSVELAPIGECGSAECNEGIDWGVASAAVPISIGSVGAIFSIGAVDPIRRFCATCRNSVAARVDELAERTGETIQLCHAAEA